MNDPKVAKYRRTDETVSIATVPYPPDKAWGISLVALSILGLAGGLLLGAGGVVIGATGSGSGMSIPRPPGAGRPEGYNPFGLVLAGYGFFLAAVCLAHLVGGVGVARSVRWGFGVTIVAAVLHMLLSLAIIPFGIVGILISGVIVFYCTSRIKGRRGPVPT